MCLLHDWNVEKMELLFQSLRILAIHDFKCDMVRLQLEKP